MLTLSGGLAPILVPIPIAICVARRARETTAMLLAVAVAAGVIGPGLVVAAALGALTGWGIRLGLTYTRVVFVAALAVFGLSAALTVVQWDQTVEEIEQGYQELGRQIEEAESSGLSNEALANIEVRHWLLGNWRDTLPGMSFAGILMTACLVVGVVGKWLRVRDNVKIRAAFASYRPSDWLVWLVIAAALLWFIDQRWHTGIARIVSWNLIFALAGIYWVNGLALFVYGLAAWKPNIYLTVALVLVLVYGLMPMLAMVGLFDTWGQFRPRMDALIAARDAQRKSHDDST